MTLYCAVGKQGGFLEISAGTLVAIAAFDQHLNRKMQIIQLIELLHYWLNLYLSCNEDYYNLFHFSNCHQADQPF
jgi:hypothetical protein